MRVVQDLKAKGVHSDIIDKTVSAAYQDVNEEKLAREYLQRKAHRNTSNSTRRSEGDSRFCELYQRWRRKQDIVLRQELDDYVAFVCN